MGEWAVRFWSSDYISHHCIANWQTFSWVMIYNNANNTANLHKHIHYWRLNCGAAVNVLGNKEDRERVLILAPDSRFPLSSYILQPFSWLLINDDPYKPIKLHKHTYEWKPSCKAALTIYKQKEVRCTILGPIFSAVQFWAPDYISHHCIANIVMGNDLQ